MPPQQSDGLLGGFDERFDFGAHVRWLSRWMKAGDRRPSVQGW
jgi:hypothetical protein